MNFLKIFSDSFQDNWEAPAITSVQTGMTIDYASLASRMARVHTIMSDLGMVVGSRVAISGYNSLDWVTVYMAVITYGATVVVIPPFYTLDEVISFAGMVESEYLFIDEATWSDAADFDTAPSLRLVISMDTSRILAALPGAPENVDKVLEGTDIGFTLKYPMGFQQRNIHSPVLPPDALMAIFFTAGTTGTPKAVMLSADSVEGNVIYGIKSGIHPRGSRVLTAVSLGNIWGCVFDLMVGLASGAHIYVFSRGSNTHDFIGALAIARPNKILLSPRQVHGIYHRAERRVMKNPITRILSRIPGLRMTLRYSTRRMFNKMMGGHCSEIIIGGSAPSTHLEWSLNRIGVKYTVCYGLTECGGIMAYTPAGQWEPGTVGHAARHLFSCRVKPLDIEGLPEGAGELQIRGMTVMKGYYGEDDLTRQVLDSQGWLSTGDLATISPKGIIRLYGRIDSMITRPGGIIFPEKLELMLITQSGIKSAVIVDREGVLTAIVEPDTNYMERHGITPEESVNMINHAVREVNRLMSLHERIDDIEISPEPLLLTAKATVRRYEYY